MDDKEVVRLARSGDGSVCVAGSVDGGRGIDDVFVAKLDPDRSTLAWVAYLGGEGASHRSGIVVSGGEPVLAGRTLAADFPLVRSIQPAAGGGLDGENGGTIQATTIGDDRFGRRRDRSPRGGVITSPTPLDIQGGVLQGIGTVGAGAT